MLCQIYGDAPQGDGRQCLVHPCKVTPDGLERQSKYYEQSQQEQGQRNQDTLGQPRLGNVQHISSNESCRAECRIARSDGTCHHSHNHEGSNKSAQSFHRNGIHHPGGTASVLGNGIVQSFSPAPECHCYGCPDESNDTLLVYTSTREITNSGRTYNNKTYEYTHGKGQIVIDSTSTTETGAINYIQKDVSGKDEQLGITKPEIYFGLETNDIIATNTKNKQEYDYTDEDGLEHTSTYSGSAGLQLNFIDRLILGIKTGDLKLAFSSEITEDSKILINRNIVGRAKRVMPYLIYDENPYTVVTEEGKIVWVLDAYTVSNEYPYSQYTTIEHDGIKEKINYIRNSVKVIIDAYDGTMKFYVTDKTDPIAMAYRNTYLTVFEDINSEIPQDISKHFIYPEYLYNVQAKLLKIYHNVKPDILYRTDDLWDFAKYNNTIVTKSSGAVLKPYYTMVNLNGRNEIGLIQVYTPNSKQNLNSYLVGTTNGNINKLKLYKFSQDSNILGPMQLDNQIEQDELISSEIKALNTTGTRVTKDMVVVPVNNTLLYVESIYQTMLNEESKIPMLKKVVVASGNKVAIGNNLEDALKNLLSKEASNIEVENTDDIDGLIDSIIKANKNLSESTSNNDWELMGSDKVQGRYRFYNEEYILYRHCPFFRNTVRCKCPHRLQRRTPQG